MHTVCRMINKHSLTNGKSCSVLLQNLRASCACVMHTSTAMLNLHIYDIKFNIMHRMIQNTAAPAATRNHIHPYSFYLALFRCQMSTVVLFSLIFALYLHIFTRMSFNSFKHLFRVLLLSSGPVRLINPSV